MTDLTEQAAAWVAAGNKSGPGTDVCSGCEGPKEASRLNSARCRACGKGGLRASPSTQPRRTLRTSVPVDVAEAAAARCEAEGITVAAALALLVTQFATGHAHEPIALDPDPVIPKPPTKREWAALNTWLALHPGRPTPEDQITTKSGLIAWATEHGYTP